jgi:hypothetical protein
VREVTGEEKNETERGQKKVGIRCDFGSVVLRAERYLWLSLVTHWVTLVTAQMSRFLQSQIRDFFPDRLECYFSDNSCGPLFFLYG